MYCPLGFRLFGDFLEICYDAANIRVPIPKDYLIPRRKNGLVDWERDIVFENQVWGEWIIQSYLSKRKTRIFACSPEGMVLEISIALVCMPNSICAEFDPAQPRSKFVDYFLECSDNYPLIDTDSWVFDLKKILNYLDANEGQVGFESFEQHNVCNDFTEEQLRIDALKHIDKTQRYNELSIARKIQHLQGWAICIKDEDFIVSGTALLKFLGVDCVPTSKGKELEDNSPRATKDRIIRLFDNNGAITFESAMRECGPNQTNRQFRFAWNLAREDRPEISKPGPRPIISNP